MLQTHLAIAVLATLSVATQLIAQTPREVALDSIVAHHMAAADIFGVSAAIVIDQRVVWTKGYGFMDWQRQRPFTPNTIMNVASVTKPMVGVALMRAVSEGKLSLDADINDYLPFRVVNPHKPTARITLRQLATHTSSITDRWDVYRTSYHFGGDAQVKLSDFLTSYFSPTGKNYSKDNFLDAAPGELREYSNIGASLAGYIVERAVGAPLNVYTKQHVFTPLGMSRTGWNMRDVNMNNHSTLFVSQNGVAVPIMPYAMVTYPDGGMRTSVADLTKFFIAMLNNGESQGVRILDSASAAEMKRFQFTDSNRPTNFPAADGNSGLFWRTRLNGAQVGHGGNDPGVETEMLVDASKPIAVVFMSNTSLSGAERRESIAIVNALWAYARERYEARGR